jgi:hypothetical protein
MKNVLLGRMLAADSGATVAAHSVGSAIVGVIASEHSTSASGIVVGETDTGGATSAMAYVDGSIAGVRITG